jgi:CubicO group peptidase (beta-lactamase class C family)
MSVLVGRRGDILVEKVYGFKSILPHKEPLEEHNTVLYDLASLTKPLVTAFLVVYFLEKEKKNLNLDTGVKTFFPHLPFNPTLLHLLTHTSGLPAWFPFYLFGDDYLKLYPLLKPAARPGKRIDYSCPGYILLHYIIEKISGAAFADIASQVIFQPLGLTNTFLKAPGQWKKNAAPTENGNIFERKLARDWAAAYDDGKHRSLVDRYNWRTGMIQGETHDVNSHHLGGSAGNAGLFSTSREVFRLCREFFPSSASILSPQSIELFRRNFTPFKKSHRTVGFKRNSSFITSGGRALARSAFGHNGFTGTCLWLEPRGETVFILLSNRIHPEFKPFNFNRARRRIHRLLAREIDL